jgi:type I restriction-modification system DNA methylase subunit
MSHGLVDGLPIHGVADWQALAWSAQKIPTVAGPPGSDAPLDINRCSIGASARYSRRVGIEEIERNDFNLNISRYVCTTVAEEAIDLAAVHAELVLLDQQIKSATRQHNELLKKLGLPLLP